MPQLQKCSNLIGITIKEYGIPGIVLMENAGHGTFSFLENELGSFAGKTAVVFIGPGNNGGDGLVIARLIHQAGGHPLLLFSTPPERLKGDAAINYSIVQNLSLPYLLLSKLLMLRTSQKPFSDSIGNVRLSVLLTPSSAPVLPVKLPDIQPR